MKRNPVVNDYHNVSELHHVLKSDYYEALGYNNVDWFVDEVIKIEQKRLSILKILRKISL